MAVARACTDEMEPRMYRLAILMVAFLAFLPEAASDAVQDAAVEADLVLKGATLHDGSGSPGKIGDVAIKNDRIVAVGKFKVKGKPRILDCEGLIVSPGFIDLHTHSDYPLQDKKTSANLNYQMQGVTTVVTGNCGAGPVDVAAYFAKLEKVGVGTNVIHQVPHNDLRQKVMGNANREPTAKDLKAMEDLVEQGMKDGAWGLATGLIYNPGAYAKTEELIALAKVAALHKGLYASHIRDEGSAVLAAIEEVLEIARRAGIRVHISHIKVEGRTVWGKAPDVIALLRRARKDGIEVTADQYPYTAWSTSLTATFIPAKYREGSAKEMIARLDDKEIGPKMTRAIELVIKDYVGGKIIKIARYAKNAKWQGKDLLAIAEAEKKSVLDIVIEITRNGDAQIVGFGMKEDDVRLFMKEPFVATASDGSSMLPGDTMPHPRSYGTFPRKIGRYAIADQDITVEHAIRSATGLPADILNLPERGYLKAGYYADIVVFNPKTFRDKATYDQPHQFATGVRYLFVNGRLAIDDGKATDALPGRVLRHASK
jgi:N-acyl-D-amino-acid deacylase